MAGLHRPVGLCLCPAVALRTDPPDGRQRPHLSLLDHRSALCCGVDALPVAHHRDLARGDAARRGGALIAAGSGGLNVEGDAIIVDGAGKLPPCLVSAHIHDLAVKARLQGPRRLDQTLLLRGLAGRLRGSNQFGAFASDTLMKLGLLGTIIGFIMMLAPIAGLDPGDRGAIKSSMNLMSDGMAVAMYTTLAGLVGSILVRIQYYMLDDATAKLFAYAVGLTEVRVVSVLEDQPGAAE